jgi:hypothetical protein
MVIFPQIAFALNNPGLWFHHLDLLLDERRQRSEQYFTSSQTAFHFLRQAKGRSHIGQIFCGRSDFFIMFQCLKVTDWGSLHPDNRLRSIGTSCRRVHPGRMFGCASRNAFAPQAKA